MNKSAVREKAYTMLWTGDELINTLVYSPPSGKEVRTYYKGHLDPRAGNEEDFPRFDEASPAIDWLVAHPGEKCLVEVGATTKIIDGPFAEPV